jgi:TRAP-type mannitol/chloroaromatic compound transport system permease small subunit
MIGWLARIYSWFTLIIVLLVVTNVLGRYFFDLRFDFAVDVAPQLYTILIIFGCSYSLSKGTHIRTDLFWNKFSDKTKALIDLASYVLLFFPTFFMLTYVSLFDSLRSVAVDERSSATMSQLVIWPMKIGITIGLVLLMWQAAIETRKCVDRWSG